MTTQFAQFSYDKASETLSAFASDLGLRPGQWPTQLVVVGRTEQTFLLESIRKDEDGDTTEVVYRHPVLRHAGTVRIFND